MGETYEGSVVGVGTRIQAGVPTRRINYDRKVNGLLLRGVVTATYVTDSSGHPLEDYAGDSVKGPRHVYCDVLVYPSIPGQRWIGLTQVLVSQPTGGMHRGRIWKPRATTMNLAGRTAEVDQTINPAEVDGDHVLVGFLNDSFDQPVILRGLPHPKLDTGHEERELGKRMKLVVTDGDPDYFKHHGVYYGVSDIGSFIVDTTWANNGELDDDGHEANPPTDGKGGVNLRLPQHAGLDVVFYDMTDPAAPNEVMKFSVDKDKLLLKVTQGDSLKVEEDGADAKLTLGNGAVKVAVADHLQPQHENHTHPTGTGPSGKPNEPWDTDINSSQLLIPDTQ